MTNLTGKEPQTWRLSISGRSYEKVSPKKDKLIVAESAPALFLIEGGFMAKDDYHVIAYKILAYLYTCLKEGRNPEKGFEICAKIIKKTPIPHLHSGGPTS